MTKRVACLCFQRVGGCCEPITDVRNGLWLLSRRFESAYAPVGSSRDCCVKA